MILAFHNIALAVYIYNYICCKKIKGFKHISQTLHPLLVLSSSNYKTGKECCVFTKLAFFTPKLCLTLSNLANFFGQYLLKHSVLVFETLQESKKVRLICCTYHASGKGKSKLRSWPENSAIICLVVFPIGGYKCLGVNAYK